MLTIRESGVPELLQKHKDFRGWGVTVGGYTFVVVNDTGWRFDRENVFAALRRDHTGQPLEDRGRWLARVGYSDGWDVGLNDDLTTFVISAPPKPTMELVAWVRAFVPADVELVLFEDQLSFAPVLLPVGITPEQVRSRFFPDAWRVEQSAAPGPRPPAERLRKMNPPNVP